MARVINLATPDFGVTDGMELSFRAPCDSTDVTGITLDGVNYDLVDASGASLTSCSTYFAEGSMVTVIIDTSNRKASVLNPRVNTYTKSLGTPNDTASSSGTTVWARVKQIEGDMLGKAPSVHTHTKSQISDFAHNHDERYYTESEIDSKLSGKSNVGHTHTTSEIDGYVDPSADITEIRTWQNNVYNGQIKVGKALQADVLSASGRPYQVKNNTILNVSLDADKAYAISLEFGNLGDTDNTNKYLTVLLYARSNKYSYSTLTYNQYYVVYHPDDKKLAIKLGSSDATGFVGARIREL